MEQTDGYIILPRTLWTSDTWTEATGDQIKAYLDLCFRAAFTEYDYEGRLGKATLKKGQLLTSLRVLAASWNTYDMKVRRILNFLEDKGLIRREKKLSQEMSQFTLLTIKALEDTEENDLSHYNNNYNKEEEKKTPRAKRFVIPTIAEIQKYLDEKHETRFTAEDFFYWYESCGWVVGHDRPMKSWKGAVMTWIQTRNKKANNGNKINYKTNGRRTEKARQQREFEQHIIAKLTSEEKRDDELPFQ